MDQPPHLADWDACTMSSIVCGFALRSGSRNPLSPAINDIEVFCSLLYAIGTIAVQTTLFLSLEVTHVPNPQDPNTAKTFLHT